MTKDDIIRKFLDLHPDTPIDGQEYAIPLRTISRMLEVAAAVEREECAKGCEHFGGFKDGYSCAAYIRARGQE